jgi:hypothetical protein
MTVQTTGDTIVMTTADFQATIDGVTWGIKCRDVAGIQFVMIVEKQGTAWGAVATLDDAFDTRRGEYTDMLVYIREYLIPKINAWLKTKFGPGKALTKFEQVDKLLLGLKLQTDTQGNYFVSI